MLLRARFMFLGVLAILSLIVVQVDAAISVPTGQTTPTGISTPTSVSTPTGLPAGCHLAKPEEAQEGIIAGKTTICPKDSELGLTGEAGKAKAYLLGIARNLRNSQAPPTKERIDALNNSFAICAARFLKAYKDQYGDVFVVSAFRCGPNSPANIKCDRTENQRAGGATGSNHQTGLAMDVTPANGNYQQLWDFAKKNPHHGVCFPYLGDDRPHLAYAGANTGEAQRCRAQGIKSGCSGVPDVNAPQGLQTIPANIPGLGNPNLNPFASPYNPTQQNGHCVVSTSPLVIVPCGQAPGMAPAPMQQPQAPAQSIPTSQAIPTPNSGAVPTETGTQPQSPLPGNTSVNTTLPAITPVSDLLSKLPKTTSIATSSKATSTKASTTPSAFDRLTDIAGGTQAKSVPTATSVPVALNSNLSDVTTGGTASTTPLPDAAGPLPNAVTGTQIAVQQTFNAPQPTTYAAPNTFANQTFVVSVLTTLRNVLTSVRDFLKYEANVPTPGQHPLWAHPHE